MSRTSSMLTLVLAMATTLLSRQAYAFGPKGHEIAGRLAETALCPAAERQVAALGRGQSLAELGLWADRIRSQPKWRHTGPWHYMNIADPSDGDAAAAIRDFVHPPERDVLWAIEHYAAVLADRSAPRSARAEALRFVVHFVVDVHQPLHVGRAEDRGGNAVDVRYDATVVNLHRFWDTDVIELEGLSVAQFVRRLAASTQWRSRAFAAARTDLDPAHWATESLALRPLVYGFEQASSGRAAVLDAKYVAAAERAVEGRLALAAARLAGVLNRAFCSD